MRTQQDPQRQPWSTTSTNSLARALRAVSDPQRARPLGERLAPCTAALTPERRPCIFLLTVNGERRGRKSHADSVLAPEDLGQNCCPRAANVSRRGDEGNRAVACDPARSSPANVGSSWRLRGHVRSGPSGLRRARRTPPTPTSSTSRSSSVPTPSTPCPRPHSTHSGTTAESDPPPWWSGSRGGIDRRLAARSRHRPDCDHRQAGGGRDRRIRDRPGEAPVRDRGEGRMTGRSARRRCTASLGGPGGYRARRTRRRGSGRASEPSRHQAPGQTKPTEGRRTSLDDASARVNQATRPNSGHFL